MAGHLAAGQPREAKALWNKYEAALRNPAKPLLRLLRCHAERGTATAHAACAAAFAGYAG